MKRSQLSVTMPAMTQLLEDGVPWDYRVRPNYPGRTGVQGDERIPTTMIGRQWEPFLYAPAAP